jgi:hypothetical protein
MYFSVLLAISNTVSKKKKGLDTPIFKMSMFIQTMSYLYYELYLWLHLKLIYKVISINEIFRLLSFYSWSIQLS